MIRDVRGNILQRYSHVDTSLSVPVVSDRSFGRNLGGEKAMRLFRAPGKAISKWRKKALFVDLHRTRITIWTPPGKHLPPWIFRRLTAYEKDRNHS